MSRPIETVAAMRGAAHRLSPASAVHRRVWWRLAGSLVAAVVLACGHAAPSRATTVEEIVSPGGVRAWFVRAPGSPIVAMHFAFIGGTAQDPAEKEGAAVLLAALLTEGAADAAGVAFREAAGRAGLRLDFSAARDAVFGSAEFLSRNHDTAVELVRRAVQELPVDEAVIARLRDRMRADIADAAGDQRAIAHKAWHERAFAGHAYARPAEGTDDSIGRIASADLVRFRRRLFCRGALRAVVVADLAAEAAGRTLDTVFAALPVEIEMVPPRTIMMRPDMGATRVEGDFQRALAVVGLPFPPPHDADFPAALVLQRILGGDQLEARLLQEIRVQRGLAYSASLDLAGDSYVSLLKGEVVTEGDRIDEAMAVVRQTLSALAETGPSDEEVESAKSYLIGAFPLGFDSSSRIAANVLALRMAGHPPDYLQRRAAVLAAVTRADVHRVARQWLRPAAAGMVIVGPGRGKP